MNAIPEAPQSIRADVTIVFQLNVIVIGTTKCSEHARLIAGD